MTEPRLTMSRAFALAAPADEASLSKLRSTAGIASVRAGAGMRRIEVCFDLRCLDGTEVERTLRLAGLPLSDGFFARLSRRWSAFREKNLRDQSKIEHRCCSKWSEDG